jgi:predicted RNase H-like nuclease
MLGDLKWLQILGVDLAWSDSTRACETGVVALARDGRVLASEWTVGVAETVAWLEQHADEQALPLVDAPGFSTSHGRNASARTR